jgi:hypothetical protein
MGLYSNNRERAESVTNFIRPRYIADGGVPHERDLVAVITLVDEGPNTLCWGVAGSDGVAIVENLQMVYNPWTGAYLPADVDELRAASAR